MGVGVPVIPTFNSLIILYMNQLLLIEVEKIGHLESAEAADLCTTSTSSCDD